MKYAKALSEEIAAKHSKDFDVKNCYQNTHRLATNFYKEIENAEIEILFCYFPSQRAAPGETVFVRHSFVLVNGDIVEPLLHIGLGEMNLDEIIPIRRLGFAEYCGLTSKEGLYDLYVSLLPDEVKAFVDNKVGYKLNQSDFSRMVNLAAEHLDDKQISAMLASIQAGNAAAG